jgi:hypothetical protein
VFDEAAIEANRNTVHLRMKMDFAMLRHLLSARCHGRNVSRHADSIVGGWTPRVLREFHPGSAPDQPTPRRLWGCDKVIQSILRHEDVKTTQRSYIKTVPSAVTEAMKRLVEQKIACAADVQQVSVN